MELTKAHSQKKSKEIPPGEHDKVTDPTKARVSCLGVGMNAGYLSLLVLVVQNAALVLMTRWSRAQQKGKMYKSTTLILMAEVVKMVASLVLMYAETSTSRHTTEAERGVPFHKRLYHVVVCLETVKLGVPAFLFTLQNYLLFISLSNLDAMTFQLLSQIKLLLAAIFSVWLLDRYLTCVQWSSVVLLTLGIMLSTQGQGSEKVVTTAVQNTMLGAVSCVVSGTSSAFASVYFEKILKGTPPSIAVRNIQLGIFSLVLATLSVLLVEGIPGRTFMFFEGWGVMTWVLVCVHAGGGILVAVVVKYADNILKGFATGVAIILSGIFAALVWDFQPTRHFIFGAAVVTAGTCIYNIPDPDHPTIKKLARMMPGGHRIPQPSALEPGVPV